MKDDMGRSCSVYVDGKYVNILVGKPEGNIALGRSMHRSKG
jgi:hypothetical protein